MPDQLFTGGIRDAEVEALRHRVKELEDALREISDIAKVSEGPAAQFYGMLADKALKRPADL